MSPLPAQKFENAQNKDHPNLSLYIYTYKYKLLNGGWFWGLVSMIGETMMTFFGSPTMRVSAIGIVPRNPPKKLN